MSDMDLLLRQLEEQKEENERLRNEAARQKEEAAQQRERADRAEAISRKTTFTEYLRACNDLVLSQIVLSTDSYLTTTVPTTNPTGKHCPKMLIPWGNQFLKMQKAMIQKVATMLPGDARLFETISFLDGIGSRMHERPVTSEAALVFVENNSVEDPVRILISKLKNYQPERYGMPQIDGVYFETTASNLRNKADGSNTNRDAKLRTDQICVFQRNGDSDKLAFVIEYKAPKKLHTAHLEQGLRQMNIVDEVVNRPTIPKLDPERFQYYADLLSTAALTQTYHYMIESGLELGYVTNGDSYVYLKIDWAKPERLYFHLAQPAREVEANNDPVYSNAVCQVLVFALLALQTSPHSNDERIAAMTACNTWEVDFDAVVHEVMAMEAEVSGPSTPSKRKHRRVPSSPEWLPAPVKKTKRAPNEQEEARSDRVLRSRTRRDEDDNGSGGGAAGGAGASGGDAAGGAGASQEHLGLLAPTLPSQGSLSTIRPIPQNYCVPGQFRTYCTPLCLLSLRKGWPLDPKCPNAPLHVQTPALTRRPAKAKARHPVSYDAWMELLRQQLSKTLDGGVCVLGLEGATGAMIQLTLLAYGYTFLAKGVTEDNVQLLQKEEAVYERLEPLQGRHIPVCLGSVDLRPLGQMLFYFFDVRIVYFLLLSYGGPVVKMPADDAARTQITDRVGAILDKMHALGVVHGDVRVPNVLQAATGQISLIDFDRAVVQPTSARVASAISSRKRKQLLEDEEAPKQDNSVEAVLYRYKVREDKASAAGLFYRLLAGF